MKESGTLILIGGGEDKKGEMVILNEFVRLCGGKKANIIIITAAAQESKEVGQEYTKIFKSLHAHADFIEVKQREDTVNEKSLTAIKNATGVFFNGGDQLLITTALGGSSMEKLLKSRHKEGMVIGGTSAGAAMMAHSMIVRGETNAMAQFRNVELGPGLDFLPGVVIDTHFSERGRFARLLLAVAHYPQDLGLGIDRNTGMVVKNEEFEVIGEGTVTVMDAGDNTYSNLSEITGGGSLSIYGVKVHLISSGHRFNMKTKTSVLPKKTKTHP
jgi:cyanophycinase